VANSCVIRRAQAGLVSPAKRRTGLLTARAVAVRSVARRARGLARQSVGDDREDVV
jgi:hypothetical protein